MLQIPAYFKNIESSLLEAIKKNLYILIKVIPSSDSATIAWDLVVMQPSKKERNFFTPLEKSLFFEKNKNQNLKKQFLGYLKNNKINSMFNLEITLKNNKIEIKPAGNEKFLIY